MIKYQEDVIANGRPITNFTVAVYAKGTLTLSSLYSDNAVTTKVNPFTVSDVNGHMEFYAADGRYDYKISGTGIEDRWVYDILLEDPAYGSSAVITGGTIDGAVIGGTNPAAVTATTLKTNGLYDLNNVKIITNGKLPIDYKRPTTVLASPPSFTYSLSAPIGLRPTLPWGDAATIVNGIVTYSSGPGILDFDTAGGFSGIDFIFTGTSFVFAWKTQASASERVMVYVNGQPCMASVATPTVSTTAGSLCYMTVTFSGAVKDTRIEILCSYMNSLVALYLGATATSKASPEKRKVLLIGDSFLGGSAAVTASENLPASILQLDYDLSIVVDGLGGTGHISDGAFKRFSDASRTLHASKFQPDQIIVMGSINDDGLSGIQAGATLTITNYRTAAPNAKIVIFGPQPTNATDTLSSNRRTNNQAVKAAAVSKSITFIDMIGHAGTDTLLPFTAFTFFDPQVLIYALGSIWLHDSTASTQYPPSGPGLGSGYPVWKLLTSGYYGTGRVGATASDGSRDTILYSDTVHPTVAGCALIASLMVGYLTN